MSKKYKDALDKIVVSDELKAKISSAAAKKTVPDKSKIRRRTYIRYAAYAACLAICLISVPLIKNINTAPGYTEPVLPAFSPPPAENTFPSPPAEEPKKSDTDVRTASPAPNRPSVPEDKNSTHDVPHCEITPDVPDNTENAPVSAPPLQSAGNQTQPPEDEDPEMSAIPGGAVNSPFGVDEIETLSNIRDMLGYDFKVPEYLPDGYSTDGIALLFGTMIQLTYTDNGSTITYRTEKSDGDISGDYNIYDDILSAQIGGLAVTVRGSGGLYSSAVWQDGEFSCSLYSSKGLDESEFTKIIKSMQFSENTVK